MAASDMSFAQLQTELTNNRLNDPTNVTWSQNVIADFLTQALNDPAVYIITRDKTITTANNQVEYPVPSAIDEVLKIGIDINMDGNDHKLSPAAWEVVNGTIIIQPFYYNALPYPNTMIVTGTYHLTQNDTVPAFLQEYVLKLAEYNAFDWLTSELGSTFLTNDMTMADLTSKMNTIEARILQLRRGLSNRYLVVL